MLLWRRLTRQFWKFHVNVISQTFVRTQCFLEGAIRSSFGKRSFVHRFRSVRSEIVRAYVLSQRESQVEISGVSKKVSRTVLCFGDRIMRQLDKRRHERIEIIGDRS